MPSIGSVSFDVMNGLPQAPLSPDQVSDALIASIAAGQIPGETPTQDSVDLLTQKEVTTEGGCATLANQCRDLIGTVQTITVDTGVTVAYQYIQSVECQWKAVKSGPTNTFLFRANWRVIATYRESDISENRTLAEVYSAKVFGQWTREPRLRCYGAAEGLGSYAGECDLIQKVGTVQDAPADPVNVVGKWIEIRARTALNLPAIPIWWGFVKEKSITRLPSGSEVTFRAVGLVAVLSNVYLKRWYELRKSDGTIIDPGSMLPFNGDTSNGNRDRAGTSTVSGLTNFIHDRARVSAGDYRGWRAIDILGTVLAAAADDTNDGLVWVLTGQTNALNYQFFGDLSGQSVFEILQTLATPSRGITFQIRPDIVGSGSSLHSTANIYVEISTTLDHTVTIASAGVPIASPAITFPAAARQTDYDLSLNKITDWNISEDHSQVFDKIVIEGERPLHSHTVGCTAADVLDPDNADTNTVEGNQFNGDWTNAQRDTWEAGDEKRRNQPDIAHVYRRFVMKQDWFGGYYQRSGSSTEIGVTRMVDASGSENGYFDATEFQAWPHGANIKLTKSLPHPAPPIAADANWFAGLNTLLTSPLDFSKPNERVHAYKVSAGNAWTPIHFDYEVTIDEDRCTITVGRNAEDAAAIKQLFDDDYDLAFTIGYEFPKTWRVSWKRSPPGLTGLAIQQPRDCERTLWLKVSGDAYQQVVIDKGTVFSVNDATGHSPNVVPEEYEIRPGTMAQALELAKLRYTKPQIRAAWTLDGELDLSAANRPGVLVRTLRIPFARRDSQLVDVGATLTRRSWSFITEHPLTKYEAVPLLTDINDVTAMPEGTNAMAGNGGANHPHGVSA